MKKIQRLLLSVFLSISLMCGSSAFSINAYAVSLSDINAYFDVQRKFYQILDQTTDIQTTQEHQTSILNKMYDLLEENGFTGERSGEGLEQNGDVTINSTGDVVLSVDLQNALKNATQYEIDNNMGYKYVYSFSGADWIDAFSDQETYHSFLDVLSSNSGNLCYVSTSYTGYNLNIPTYIGVFKEGFQFVYDSNSTLYGTPTYHVDWYENWNTTSYSTSLVKNYFLNTETGLYEEVDNSERNGSGLPNFRVENNSQIITINSNSRFFTTLNRTQYVMYMTYDDMRLSTEGLQPYYVGNDFSTSEVSTTQTITDSMLNSSISYSNITDYVNNYYVTNTTYPSSQDVYNYINNYDGSGGSGGPGESGDNDDDNNFDWGFLGTIGDFLGGLLSGISGVISGLLEGITGIIDLFIGSENAETGQREGGLPSIIGQLLNYFLPFLPSEILTLIELSIVLALIIGVVKLIRGS